MTLQSAIVAACGPEGRETDEVCALAFAAAFFLGGSTGLALAVPLDAPSTSLDEGVSVPDVPEVVAMATGSIGPAVIIFVVSLVPSGPYSCFESVMHSRHSPLRRLWTQNALPPQSRH